MDLFAQKHTDTEITFDEYILSISFLKKYIISAPIFKYKRSKYVILDVCQQKIYISKSGFFSRTGKACPKM